ncbi:hypothetical protein HKBW3S09_01719, partial [Candidatus Hakubella thermalkaliphila]
KLKEEKEIEKDMDCRTGLFVDRGFGCWWNSFWVFFFHRESCVDFPCSFFIHRVFLL